MEGLFQRHGVGPRRILLASKSAQAAGGNTNIGGIDVPVDIEICHVSVQAFANMVGQPANGQDVSRAVERYRLIKTEPLAGKYLCGDGLQAGVVRLERMR